MQKVQAVPTRVVEKLKCVNKKSRQKAERF